MLQIYNKIFVHFEFKIIVLAINQSKNKPQQGNSGTIQVKNEIKLNAAAATSKKENPAIDKKSGCC